MEKRSSKDTNRYEVYETSLFEKKKKDILKKDRSFSKSINDLVLEMESGVFKGESLGNGIFKERIAKQGKGKSGGYRVIYYVIWGKEAHLITAYDKSEISDIPKSDLVVLIKKLFNRQ
jgi:hypothetical protein